MAIETRAQYFDYVYRVAAGDPVSREEHIAAARFLICVSAARRNAHKLAEGDASEGLEILRALGEDVPTFAGYGWYFADRAREWFTARYGE